MRYGTRLLVTFAGAALLTNGLSLFVLDRMSLHYLFNGYRAKLLSICVTTATMLDGDLLKQVQAEGDQRSPAYAELRAILARARVQGTSRAVGLQGASGRYGHGGGAWGASASWRSLPDRQLRRRELRQPV